MALTLAQQLADAEEQYHELVLGRAARVVVDSNGERVEFTAANKQGLYVYIQQLRSQIAAVAPAEIVTGPMRVIF